MSDKVLDQEETTDSAAKHLSKSKSASEPTGLAGVAHKLYTGQLSVPFVEKKRVWYLISAVMILVCLIGLTARGLSLGIEFKGGSQFQASVQVTDKTVDEVRNAIVSLNLPEMDNVTVTTLGETTVQVQTRALSSDEVAKVRQSIANQVGLNSEDVSSSLIGPSWGSQVTKQSTIALVVFLVLAFILMAFYFRNWKMSLSAMIALLHDLVVTVGVYALIGFTVTPATVIGVLTILGYSLYDTVVVFDMVRENTVDIERKPYTYSAGANKAVNQVLIRSINTTIIGVLPVIAIVIMGAFVLKTGPLEDLGLALLVGMVAGAYSSIFIATPLLCQLKEREPAMVKHREVLARHANTRLAKEDTKSNTSKGGSQTESDLGTTKENDSVKPRRSVVETVDSPVGRAQPRNLPRKKRKK